MNIVQKLKNLGLKLFNIGKNIVTFAVEYAILMTTIFALSIIVLKLPEIQNKYYHLSVGSKVYMIKDSFNSGGGTGFAIKAPSGQNYILTNDHVCAVSKDKRTVLVIGNEGSMRRNIIAHDENSDLCLIEGMPGVEGMSVAWFAPSIGDIVSVVGHPRLMPKHVSSGEMIGSEDITLPLGPISVINPRDGTEIFIDPAKGGISPSECAMNKHSQELVNYNFFFMTIKVKFCMLTVKAAYTTTVTIHGGNSGSPMINFWGNVIGVAFAADDTNWGRIISLHDIKEFLKNY